MAKEITFIHVQNNTLTESQFAKIMKAFLKNRKWYLTYSMVKNNPKNNFWFQMGFCHSSDFIATHILNIAVDEITTLLQKHNFTKNSVTIEQCFITD